jgi:hypothetical protein
MDPEFRLITRKLKHNKDETTTDYELFHFSTFYKSKGKLHKVSIFKEVLDEEEEIFDVAFFLEKTPSITGKMIKAKEKLTDEQLIELVENETSIKLEL